MDRNIGQEALANLHKLIESHAQLDEAKKVVHELDNQERNADAGLTRLLGTADLADHKNGKPLFVRHLNRFWIVRYTQRKWTVEECGIAEHPGQ